MISDMKTVRFAPLIVLAACALPPPVPVAARLSHQALKVEMSDGSACRAVLQGAAPWAGELPDCGLHYVVQPSVAGNPLRLAFDAMIAALQAGNLVAPMADISLVDGAGKTRAFASPVALDN